MTGAPTRGTVPQTTHHRGGNRNRQKLAQTPPDRRNAYRVAEPRSITGQARLHSTPLLGCQYEVDRHSPQGNTRPTEINTTQYGKPITEPQSTAVDESTTQRKPHGHGNHGAENLQRWGAQALVARA